MVKLADKLTLLQKKLDYNFKNITFLKNALTHSSYINEFKNAKCNERMEFLGDSVLSVVVSEYIYNHLKNSDEGDLSKIRASVVCEDGLVKIANEISLGEYLYLSRGEDLNGGRKRKSILSDATEAVFAAIFLDGGIEEAKKVILKFTIKYINEYSGKNPKEFDYKTKLQEFVQNEGKEIRYEPLSESGPDHDKHFVFRVLIDDIPYGDGEGTSKKKAEQAAAKIACEKLVK